MTQFVVVGFLAFWGVANHGFADGLIIIHQPVAVPAGHYAFAPLEVVYHKVNVRIADQIAVTSIDQEFFNPNPQRLEGTYLFPVPKGGQINKFTMEIGGKQVEAELMAADKARKIYEDIVRTMKDPALLEYADRDVFKARIFPIEPRAKKRVTLSYSQILSADSGLVSYVYPLNTEKFSARPLKTVSVKIELATSKPLKTVYSPSHTVEIRRHEGNKATVGYEAADVRPDADFQLLFAPEAADIGTNLLTHKEPDEDGFFLLLASPGLEMKNQRVIPKDVIFVLDTSGSMAGAKLAQAKKALQFCVENLNDSDRFELIRFSTETEPLFDKLVNASEENRSRALEFVKKLKPIGGTAIDEALRKALSLRAEKSDRPGAIIFLTDGQPTIGNTNEEQIVSAVAKDRERDMRVFCFGIGADVNTHLLDRITEATRAFSQYVLPEEDLEVKLSSFFTKIKEPVLANLKLSVSGDVRVNRMHPSPLPDLFRGEQLVVLGRYQGGGNATLTLEGKVGGETRRFDYKVPFADRTTEHDFIPRLWAARRVGYLLDESRLRGENKELRDEITELARKYGIVTPYTAYLIVEDESRRGIPVVQRSMQAFDRDVVAQREAARAWDSFKEKKAGESAVAGARSSSDLKSSESAGAIEPAKKSALRALAAAAPSSSAAPAQIAQYAQQTRFVNGRNFFQNGSQWMDAGVQRMKNARPVRVRFGTQEYFDLVANHPRAQAWFALGRNLQLALGDAVYEIFE